MTLLELLAATVILSAVAAAGALILRDARSAAAHAELADAAARAVARWYVERLAAAPNKPDEPETPWEWTDPGGVRWRMVPERGPAPDATTDNHEQPDSLPVRWDTATLSYLAPPGTAPGPRAGSWGFETMAVLRVPVRAERRRATTR